MRNLILTSSPRRAHTFGRSACLYGGRLWVSEGPLKPIFLPLSTFRSSRWSQATIRIARPGQRILLP